MRALILLLCFLLGCSTPAGDAVTSTVGFQWRTPASQLAPFAAVKFLTDANSADVTSIPGTSGLYLYVYNNGVYYNRVQWSGTAGVPETKTITLPAGTGKTIELVQSGLGPSANQLEVTDVTGAITLLTPVAPRVRVVLLGDSTTVAVGPPNASDAWSVALPHNLPSDFDVTNLGSTGTALSFRTGANLAATLDLLAEVFDGEINILWCEYGINDYGAGTSAATFAARVDELRRAVRERFGSNVYFVWSSMTLCDPEGVANAGGSTRQAIRDSEHAKADTFGDLYIEGSTVLDFPADLSPDQKHPNNSGNAKKLARTLEVLEQFEGPMGTLTAYVLNRGLEHALGVSTFPTIATHYYAAYQAGVAKGVIGFTANGTNYSAVGRAGTNLQPVVWAPASGSAWNIDEWRIYDTLDLSGNCLAIKTLGAPVLVNVGQSLNLAPGEVDFTAPAGGLATAHCEKFLLKFLTGAAWTPEASLKYAYINGDPTGAGVEITGTGYARVSITSNGTNWSTGAGGLVRNLTPVAFPTAGSNWTTATYHALYDAAGTGLVFSGALLQSRSVLTGQTETILADRMRITWS